MKAKVLILNGKEIETVEIKSNIKEGLKDVLKILNTDSFVNDKGDCYLSFGNGYLAVWQNERKEKTSMELTVQAGFSYPVFIDSKVVIIKEKQSYDYTNDGEIIDNSKNVDIDMEELKQHFNTKNSFWALTKIF